MGYFIITLGEDRVSAPWPPPRLHNALGEPLDSYALGSGQAYDGPQPLRTSCPRFGPAPDWWWGPSMVPIVNARVLRPFLDLVSHDVQVLPVMFDGTATDYVVVNVLPCGDFLDTKASTFMRLAPGDPALKRGRIYQSVYRIVIDPLAANGHDLLRIKGWETPTITSARGQSLLKTLQVPGIDFIEA